MESIIASKGKKPHAVCIPFPAQGHINPMLQLAKLLHSRNFHITFVNTEYNHNRLLRSRGPTAVADRPSFRFETIHDGLGLPPSDGGNSTQDIALLCAATEQHCAGPLRELIARLNKVGDVPQVSCVVSDVVMFFAIDVAREFGLPEVLFWTASVCGLLGYAQYQQLIDLGIIPFKDPNFAKNGDLNQGLAGIPSMKGIQLKDLPTPIRAAKSNDILLNFVLRMIQNSKRSSAILINSFDALEHSTLQSLIFDFPPLYTLGPLQLLLETVESNEDETKSINTSLWKEDPHFHVWLDSYPPNSVLYVNFGSITVLTVDELLEFAWGLANSNQPFLWIARPNLVNEDSMVLPPEFLAEIKGRGLVSSWCDQVKVLAHPAIGGFLTHCGWNSILESSISGVPMICWPFFADQQTNCWFCCNKWRVGIEIDANVKRSKVERNVRELMDKEKGKEMKNKIKELRELAYQAIAAPNGSSYNNFEKVIKMLGFAS